MKVISNKQLILRITIVLIITSIISVIISAVYIKKAALYNLAEDDAHKTSELIFETMNVRMQEGWGKDDLVKILKRLEHIREGMKLHSYRNTNVEEILGINKADKLKVQNDLAIQKAMQGEKQFIILEDGSIRYLYPIRVSAECITCHYNTKVGDVNGVLDIQYPPSEIKISLDNFAVYFIIFFIIFILISFLIFFIVINKKVINPIQAFTKTIESISAETNITKKANIEANIKEIYVLQKSFNHLLKRIKYYYDKLLSNLYTDNLTSLPNMVKLEEDIKKNEYNTLMIVDIDSFREINNFYGVKVGDSILKQIAVYLHEHTQFSNNIYRIYGDEFAILTQEELSSAFCIEFIKNLNNQHYQYNNSDINVQSTLGVVYHENERIIEKATIAVRNAKKKKAMFEEFDNSKELQEEYHNHIKWTAHIKEALTNNQMMVYFQPIKNLKTNKIAKYECLSRMNYKDKVFTPEVFMDISKKSKQYPAITQQIISNSFNYFENKPDIEFSINFSIDDILNSDTTDYLFKMLKKYAVGSHLIIELLESEEVLDFDILNSFIHNVKTYGVKVAIDDFGSGYSNYAYITKLHVDFLKIDSSLIQHIDTDKDSQIIVKSIIDFAKNVGLKTIAEKVHSQEIEDILKELGIDFVQGYHIGKPQKSILT